MGNKPCAKVLLDSVSPNGVRLTTVEVTLHRFVLAEFNTHRALSRNSASSRAIPLRKQLERVLNDPAIPLSWPTEQSGMQGGEEITAHESAIREWEHARDWAASSAQQLGALGVHKSIANRLIEPFMWHTIIATGTDQPEAWPNFFGLRCNPMAQPEIQAAAYVIQDAYNDSKPTLLQYGEWHTPLIQEDEDFDLETRKKVSAARCARVSYMTHEGVRDPEKDLELFRRLVSADPKHSSPLEHVASPIPSFTLGNFYGWKQFRHEVGM